MKKHPKGALLKLPFFTTDMKKKFFANLWLTFHSWSPSFVYVKGFVDTEQDPPMFNSIAVWHPVALWVLS